MHKKMIYLVSFVLVLGLTGAAEATFDTVGVYDPNDEPHHNQVDQSGVYDSHTGDAGPENVIDLATFQALIGPAFDADAGGVVNIETTHGSLDGQDIIAKFGASKAKSLTISGVSGIINVGSSVKNGRTPISGRNRLAKSNTANFEFDIGPITGGVTDEAVTYFAGSLLDRDAANLLPIVTATFSGGGTVTAVATMSGDPPSCDQDTFFGFVAPAGQSVVNVDFNVTGGPYTNLDDVAFITSAFIVVSEQASDPDPPKGQTDVPRDVSLSWTEGAFADKHDVYFGTNFNDVNDADRTNPLGVLVNQSQVPNSYSPAKVLQWEQTYYWRIDEVNAPPDSAIFKGDVWQFTVEPFAYPIAGENIIATASSQFNADTGPENTINGSGLDDNDLHSTEEESVWFSSMTGPQPTWIQYEFDQVYKLHQILVWNHNTSIEPILGFGIKDATIEYSLDGSNWAALGTAHEFARAPGQDSYAHNTTVDLSGVVAKYVKITANSNWGGVLPQYGLSEVRFFHIPVFAREPDPASGATDADVEAVLSWRAGREAASHNVYLSADEQAVIDETISPVSIPADSSYANYATGPLVLAKSYYWKVNEVNEAETPATWQGNVWSFGTQEYLVVDDFEDYNDYEPDRIFDTWVDGWGDPANGSQVGSDMPPFAEQTIVRDGQQSMPLNYDNSTASYSEATANVANLPVDQDWTKYGIRSLSLWFHGDPNNSVEQLYVKLNDSKVTYDGDAANLTQTVWQPWNIELASFGVNLSNVTELSIGLERGGAIGGSGVVYIDDIRLYPLREPEAD